MLLELQDALVELDEKPNKSGLTMGQLLANLLASTKSKLSPLKVMPWAFKLYKNESVEVDKADTEGLIDFMEKESNANPLALFQIVEKLKSILNAG